MAIPFLTARWTHLLLATYAVPAELLTPRLTSGLELDLRNGQAFVSLVAFHFQDTRVLGVSWPGYREFAELNLRFYVRQGSERGVVFIREFVSERLVAWLARWLYNEPYRVAPIRGTVREDAGHVHAEYRLACAGREHVLAVTGRKPSYRPEEHSAEHFFKEQRWGFGKRRSGETIRYEVVHPIWDVFPVEASTIDLSWADVYGPEWAFLQKEQPCSVVFALGSEVKVFTHGRVSTS